MAALLDMNLEPTGVPRVESRISSSLAHSLECELLRLGYRFLRHNGLLCTKLLILAQDYFSFPYIGLLANDKIICQPLSLFLLRLNGERRLEDCDDWRRNASCFSHLSQ